MLLDYANYCLLGFILLSLPGVVLAGFAYLANTKRASDDPAKKDFSLRAVFFALFRWPLFLLSSITLPIVKGLAYGVFLIMFSIALLAFRPSDFLNRLKNALVQVGDKLLETD